MGRFIVNENEINGGQFSDEVNIGREPAPKAFWRFRVYEEPGDYRGAIRSPTPGPSTYQAQGWAPVQRSDTGLFGSAQYMEPIHLTSRDFWELGLA